MEIKNKEDHQKIFLILVQVHLDYFVFFISSQVTYINIYNYGM